MTYRARLVSHSTSGAPTRDSEETPAPVIEFHYDFSSPYSYLASTQIEALAARTGATIELRPFVLGAVFKAFDRPPGLIGAPPAKQQWQLQDLQAWAEHYGVPFSFPSSFPINAIRAMRQTLAAEEKGLGWAFTQDVFHAYWASGSDITDPSVLADIASPLGLNPTELARRAEEAEIKDRLRAYTDSAIGRGAFGAPTFFFDGQLFFGNDRLPFLEQAVLRWRRARGDSENAQRRQEER